MPTTIKCPACTRALEVPDQLMGKRVKCPACKMIFTATPAGKGPPPDPRAGRQSPDSKSEASVRRGSPKPPPIEIEEEDEEQPRVRKKAVRRRDEEDEEDEEEEKPRVRRKAAGRRVEEDDDEDEDEDEEEEEEPRPRRRRAGKSSRQRAQSAVLAPAICLITAGALGLLLGLALLGIKVAGKSLFEPADKEGDAAGNSMLFVMWIASQLITYRGAIVSIGWGVSVLGGGIQMKNLSNFKTVVSACILAMLPGNCFCLLGLPIGIWGLVAINRWDVKREFD